MLRAFSLLVVLTAALAAAAASAQHLPVLCMHGYGGAASDFDDILSFIADAHPGTVAVSLPLFEHAASDLALDVQVRGVIDWLVHHVASNHSFADGYHLLCHSQGTLICRGVIESWEQHRVHSFVSIAGPHLGIYGATVGPFAHFQNLTTRIAYKALYTPLAQRAYSAAGYWHDPLHSAEYLRLCRFLPALNNVRPDALSATRRRLFLRVRDVVLLGSDGDQVIVPWQSSMFGFYEVNSTAAVAPMERQPVYRNDTFGLRTMHERGSLWMHHPPGVSHGGWLHRRALFLEYMAPYLT